MNFPLPGPRANPNPGPPATRLRCAFAVAFAAFLGLSIPPVWGAEARPNIIIIYADDLGYGDLSCQGHPTIRTPNLDRMAAEGMRFTDFYSAAEVCTPSRAALLTGRYPVRSGMCHDQFRVLRNRSVGYLPQEEITTAEALKAGGYVTGLVGKWHLGVWSVDPAGHPRRHGFDHYFGLPHSNDMDPQPDLPKAASTLAEQKAEWWNSPLYRNEELIERPVDQTTLTRRYTEEAQRFIRDQRRARRPFFLYLAHTFPHTPLFASSPFRGTSRRGLYGDVVAELDWSVGQVLETLRREKLDRNTVVFFSSDNGPWLIMNQQGGSAGLLRDGKGSTWEGGMRVPGIAWWPGKIKAGSVQSGIASTLDLFTTSLRLAGVPAPRDRVVDGLDLSDTLLRGAPSPRRTMFFYRGTRLFAARQDRWKLHLFTQKSYGQPKPDAHNPPLLFDLEVDPGESFDVAALHPDVVTALRREMQAHLGAVKPAASQLEELAPARTLTLVRSNQWLTIRGAHLPGEIRIHYLEAYCRAGSTDADWVKHTVIPHTNEFVSLSFDQKTLRLVDTLADGVRVEHLITAQDDEVEFRLTAHNPGPTRSEAHWAQPCVRLSRFLGFDEKTAGSATDYLPRCFIFLDGTLARLPTRDWATQARYVPGQTWCPTHVPRTDVNPRPLSPLVPSNGLIGAFSADEKMIFATAWEPYQELFQGVARCLHSDFRLGGLAPGARQEIRGKIYVVTGDAPSLLRRYQRDFPEHFAKPNNASK